MKKVLFIVLTLLPLLLTSCEKEQIKQITTVSGNTYVSHYGVNYSSQDIFYVYKLRSDGKIDIEERKDSETGNILNNLVGKYTYNHPDLKLEIQSIAGCNDCYNYFTATVSSDRKSFSYTIYDMRLSKDRELIFNIR